MPFEIITIEPCVPRNDEMQDTFSFRLKVPAQDLAPNAGMTLEPLQWQVLSWLADINWLVRHVLYKVG